MALTIALIAFWVVFKFLDPVSLETAMKLSSDRFFSGITAPFYGLEPHPARDGEAVVLITDATLKALEQPWPLPYAQHARFLEEIIDAGAKAVLVDVRFAMQRPGDNLGEFDSVIALARERNVVLLFGQGASDYGALPAPLTEFGTLTGWSEDPQFYPLIVHDEAAPETDPGRPSAAFDLYARLCRLHAVEPCAADLEPANFENPIYLRWGSRYDPVQERVTSTQDCTTFGDGVGARFEQAVEVAGRSFFGGLRAGTRQSCFYILSVGADMLAQDDRQGEPVSALMKGRVVFYGADLRGEHDVVRTPVFGIVAGVQAHAMAFDNLLTYGSRYFHRPPEAVSIGAAGISWAEALEFLVWVAVVVFLTIRPVAPVERGSKTKPPDEKGRVSGSVLDEIMVRFGRLRVFLRSRSARAMMLAGAVVFAIDAAARNELAAAPGLLLIYALSVFVCLIGIGACAAGRDDYWARIAKAAAVVVVMFVANELVFRWPCADWFGLVLLYFAVGEVASREEGGFVMSLTRSLQGAGQYIGKHFVRLRSGWSVGGRRNQTSKVKP